MSFQEELEKLVDQYYAPIKLPYNNRTEPTTIKKNHISKGVSQRKGDNMKHDMIRLGLTHTPNTSNEVRDK